MPVHKLKSQNTIFDTLSSEYYSGSDSGLVGYWRFDSMEDLGINGDSSDDIRDLTHNGNHGDTYNDPVLVPSRALITSIENTNSVLPKIIDLKQNYPNPFNPLTRILFSLSEAVQVKLSVYNILGEQVLVLLNEYKPAGTYEAVFDGRDRSSGVYFYHLQAGDFNKVRKMLLVR